MHLSSIDRFSLHGLAVEIDSHVETLRGALAQYFGEFAVEAFPSGFSVSTGTIEPFDPTQVMRHLSPKAVLLQRPEQLIELFQDGERFWLVDDRWGMAELNLLKGTWRSWVVPHPTIDPVRVADMAVLWPLAQLLRGRGLHLLPAAAVSRGGWSTLLIGPMAAGPEIEMLVRAGYKLLGQRWTAVREEDGRLSLLHLRGQIERTTAPRLRAAGGAVPAIWTDLEGQYLGMAQHHAFCDAVILIDPARRSERASVKSLDAAPAMNVLRRAWPIAELHPGRRWRLAAKLAQRCACFEVRLSTSPDEVIELFNTARNWAVEMEARRQPTCAAA